MTFAKRMVRVIVLILTLASQNACAPVSRAGFCDVYCPVYTVAADTEETKTQTDKNNAAWLALCTAEKI